MTKPRASLDIPDISSFRPREARPADDMTEITRVAEDVGFKIRHAAARPPASPPEPAPRFDGRSLRRSKRTAQLNIATREETRDRFWMLAQEMGVTSGEEVLLALMEHYRKQAG